MTSITPHHGRPAGARTGVRLAFVAAAAALSFVVAPGRAYADGATEFVYSPIACQTFGGALWIYPSGQISNKSTTESMRVFCPLMHEAKFDDTQKTVVYAIQANQNVRDADGKVLRVRCREFWNHPAADAYFYSKWYNDGATNGVELDVIVIPGHEYLGGSMMLECVIPPRDSQGINQALYHGESRIGTFKTGVD